MSLASRPRFELMARIRRWSLSRQSPATSIRLTQKRIYILPTASGTLFLVLLMLLLLMAINYENNLIYALTFLLGSLFLVTILHTYHNLAGIQLTAVRGNHCHAGETAYFQLRLDQQGVRDRIRLLLPGGSPVTVDLVEPIHWLELGCPALERGWLMGAFGHAVSPGAFSCLDLGAAGDESAGISGASGLPSAGKERIYLGRH